MKIDLWTFTLTIILFTGVIAYAFTQQDWIGYLTLIIVAPLTIGFIISAVEFFRGTD